MSYVQLATSRRRKNESGFIILLVLGVLVALATISLAILSYTATTSKVATGLESALSRSREIDAALGTAVGQIRPGPEFVNGVPASCAPASPATNANALLAAVFENYAGTGTRKFPSISAVGCANNVPVTATSTTRDITISLCAGGTSTEACPPGGSGGGRLIGQTRVVFTDVAATAYGTTSMPGFLVNVCDWQVGRAITTTANSC